MNSNVLIVDDNPDNLLILQTILRKNGFRVRTAAGGREALALLAAEVPDAVLLDVMMPDMNGLEVLERIRETPATARLPVIMVTAKSHDEDVLRGYQCGADYYITKPCTARQLLYGLEMVLRQLNRGAEVSEQTDDAGGGKPNDAGAT